MEKNDNKLCGLCCMNANVNDHDKPQRVEYTINAIIIFHAHVNVFIEFVYIHYMYMHIRLMISVQGVLCISNLHFFFAVHPTGQPLTGMCRG